MDQRATARAHTISPFHARSLSLPKFGLRITCISVDSLTGRTIYRNRQTQPDRFYAHCPQGLIVGLPTAEDSMNVTGSSADISQWQ